MVGTPPVCAVCHEHSGKVLRVTHEPTTGVVRGLICRQCSIALDFLNDDLELIHRLAAYVRKGRLR